MSSFTRKQISRLIHLLYCTSAAVTPECYIEPSRLRRLYPDINYMPTVTGLTRDRARMLSTKLEERFSKIGIRVSPHVYNSPRVSEKWCVDCGLFERVIAAEYVGNKEIDFSNSTFPMITRLPELEKLEGTPEGKIHFKDIPIGDGEGSTTEVDS